MTVPFMRAYTELLVATCHKRGAHAMGGMAAFIPSRRDAEVNDRALAAVTADKRREATAGFDGTWVAHPDLVATAQAEFDAQRRHPVDSVGDDLARSGCAQVREKRKEQPGGHQGGQICPFAWQSCQAIAYDNAREGQIQNRKKGHSAALVETCIE